MRYGQVISVLLFYLALLLPGLQMVFGFADEEKLHGVEEQRYEAPPSLTLADFAREEYQTRLLRWWDQNIGYRGFLVRTDNQLNFSVFRQISANYASPLILGRQNSLFEKLYVDSVNGTGLLSDKQLDRITRSIQALQEYLTERGISFVLLISASKVSLYPEDVPARFLHPQAPPPEQSNYHRLVPRLREKNINFLDSRALLSQWKAAEQYPLFPKGGTHWSQYAACRIGAALLRRLQELGTRNLGALQCEPYEIKPLPEPFDRDLADLSNIWHPEVFYEPLPYPIPGAAPAPRPNNRAKVLFIGGSFLWSLFHYFDREEVYSKRDMYYYFSRRFRFPDQSEAQIDRKRLDWEQEVFSNQAIVIEVNEANIRNIGSGFIGDALKQLQRKNRSR